MTWRRRRKIQQDIIFCRFKEPCTFKQMVKPRNSKRGIYYFICTYEYGCNQKTFIPQKVKIPLERGANL